MVLFVREAASYGRCDPSARVIRAADYQIRLDAETLLRNARDEAARIVEAAQAALGQERVRGYQEGLEAARLEAAEQMIENVSRTVDYFAKVEDTMIDLVTQSMRRIIGDFDDRERVTAVVRSALTAVRNQKQVTVRIAPDRLETVRGAVDEMLASYPGIGYLDLVADGRLQGDACIIETDIGTVEASLDGQIEALRKAFAKILGGRK